MNTRSYDLSLEAIAQRAHEFFVEDPSKKLEESGLIYKKSWIFNNKCAVVDFSYKKIHFAFNIYLGPSGTVKVDVLQRESATNFRLNMEFNSPICVFEGIDINYCFEGISNEALAIAEKKRIFEKLPTSINFRPLNVGILTLPMNKNYGGNLQAYALLEVISKLGHNPIFINRRFHHVHAKISKQLYSTSVGLSPEIANKRFLDANFRKITKPFFFSEELESEINDYKFDALIVGSDQVWRPQYAKSLLKDFFLGFIPESSAIRRISYAASFGADSWEYNEKEQKMATGLVKRFNAVGVREEQALNMCKEKLNVSSSHVLDPTLLLDAKHYSDKFKLKELSAESDYLLNYVLDINDAKESVIKSLSDDLGLVARSVNGRPFTRESALDATEGDLSVEGWLASFFNAKFVVTDSFHGVAFSILFNKPFLAYANPSRGLARFTSLLRIFDLSSRLVTSSSQITKEFIAAEISWNQVNSRLNEMRKKSLVFLLDALGLSYDSIRGFDYIDSNPNATKAPNLIPIEENGVKRYHSKKAQLIDVREYPKKAGKTPFDIHSVVSSSMCIGCGACSYITQGKVEVSSDELGGESIVAQDLERLTQEEKVKANKVCPFSDHSLNEDQLDAPYFNAREFPFNEVIGRYASIFSGRQMGDEALMGSSSGGLTSWLVKKLLEKNLIDSVLHVGKAQGNDALFEYRLSSTQEELDANRKSNYYPTTLSGVLEKVREDPSNRYAIVGVPCFIKAARLVAAQDEVIANSLKYYVGIVCGHMKTRFFAESNAWQLGVSPEKIASVDFRKKIPNKKVGNYHFSVESTDGKEESIQPTSLLGGNWGHAFFQPNACNYCDDIFAETADIVFGDAWLPKYNDEWRGTNIVVSRNPELTNLLEEGYRNNCLYLEDLTLEEVVQTQFGGISHRRHGLAVRVSDDMAANRNHPSKRVDPEHINLPSWRIELFRQRKKMSNLSSKLFAEAKKSKDLNLFISEMSKQVAVYSYIESIKHKKN